MKWNKLELRELPIEEQGGDNYKTMWYGPTPEVGDKVLVTYPLSRSGFCVSTDIDEWIEFDNGVGFENTENDVIYWMELPQYNGELDD